MAFSKLLLVLASTCLAAGQFASLTSSVKSGLDNLSSQINSWTFARGVVGAIRIQSAVQPLVQNVNNLKSAAETVTPAEISVPQLQGLSNSIVAVLQALSGKEGDFSRIGVRTIVANDIQNLEAPTIQIINSLIKSVEKDCSKVSALSPLVSQISGTFSSTQKTYGIQGAQFPAPPVCQRHDTDGGNVVQVPQEDTSYDVPYADPYDTSFTTAEAPGLPFKPALASTAALASSWNSSVATLMVTTTAYQSPTRSGHSQMLATGLTQGNSSSLRKPATRTGAKQLEGLAADFIAVASTTDLPPEPVSDFFTSNSTAAGSTPVLLPVIFNGAGVAPRTYTLAAVFAFVAVLI